MALITVRKLSATCSGVNQGAMRRNAPYLLLVLMALALWWLVTAVDLGFIIAGAMPQQYTGLKSLSRRRDLWVALQDLANARLPALSAVILDMRPYHTEYWTAELESIPQSAEEQVIRVPVYPASNDPAQGLLYCPRNGVYTFTVRIPKRRVLNGLRDNEPPACGPYHMFASFWANSEKDTVHTLARKMIDLCSHTVKTPVGIVEGSYPPDVLGHAASVVFTANVICADPPDQSLAQQSKQLNYLAERVYGTNANALAGKAVETLGYWSNDTVVGATVGTTSFQPHPDFCPDTFDTRPLLFKTHQEHCKNQESLPTFRWTPFTKTREEWLLSPGEIASCIKQPISLYGDSIMHQYRRGLSCLFAGYAGLNASDFGPIKQVGLALELAPAFSSRDVGVNYTDAELDSLLKLTRPPEQANEIEVWAIGSWIAPFLPSIDFGRGIHRVFARIQARSKLHNTRPYIALLNSVSSDPTTPFEVGWQTVDRHHLFNQLVLANAANYGIKVIDTFWPTVHRFDARADNAHYCDTLNVETSMMVLKAICQDAS